MIRIKVGEKKWLQVTSVDIDPAAGIITFDVMGNHSVEYMIPKTEKGSFFLDGVAMLEGKQDENT